MESCVGGVIPNLNLTRGEIAFNPAKVLEKYLSMMDPEGLPRFLMRPRQSVSFSKWGDKPNVNHKEGGRFFNLHNPAEQCCFMAKEVLGKDTISNMIPEFCKLFNLPRQTNKDVRTTTIQTLRMGGFTTEEVAKVSRHRRPSTIDSHYDFGLRSSTKADMAAAVGQASSLKRGAEFQPVSAHLPRKESNPRVKLASPTEMVPKVAGGASSSSSSSSSVTCPEKTFIGDIVVLAKQSEMGQAENK